MLRQTSRQISLEAQCFAKITELVGVKLVWLRDGGE